MSFLDKAFDAVKYLASNPDVQRAVASVVGDIFSSPLNPEAARLAREHFNLFGKSEGRANIGELWNEEEYLRRHPDVAQAVASGQFPSGLAYHIDVGEAEGRSPGTFDEQAYRLLHPDAVEAINNGQNTSGFDHYLETGRFDEGRIVTWSGTSGNDVITGNQNHPDAFNALVGVDTGLDASAPTTGVGEIDVLIGTDGSQDTFTLALAGRPGIPAVPYYIGQGNEDYAIIVSHEITGSSTFDDVILAGTPDQYRFEALGSGSQIVWAQTNDLVAILPDVPASALQVVEVDTQLGDFILTA